MSAPFVSIVIPTHNRAAHLRDALGSVLAQTFTDYEVIVVDDGSEDDTAQVVAGYGTRVRLLSQANRGPGAARNLGVSQAIGNYLAFLDSDDLWFPWTLDIYHQVIQEIGHPAFVLGKPLHFQNDLSLATAFQQPVEFLRFADYFTSGEEWRWCGASSFVIRRDAFGAAGGFVEANINGEDTDLALKLGEAPGFAQITEPCTFGYRKHATNVTADFSKSLAGAWHQVRTELAGGYPGTSARAQERRRILTRHVRPVSLDCLRRGLRGQAWQLYRVTFRWHMRLGRWKYLLGFPIRALLHTAHRSRLAQ